MSLGMDMLFKQLGIDPAKIMHDFEDFRKDIAQHLLIQNEKLARIEQKLDILLQKENLWMENQQLKSLPPQQ